MEFLGGFIAGVILGSSVAAMVMSALCAGKIADLRERDYRQRAQDQYRNSSR